MMAGREEKAGIYADCASVAISLLKATGSGSKDIIAAEGRIVLVKLTEERHIYEELSN